MQSNESWTSLKLIQWTAGYFEKKGIPNPRLDAELLLAHVLKCKRIDLYVGHENQVSDKDLAKFKELIERRAKREPLQYIVGETEFWGLKFKVTPDVLIPRPETELLVEEAIKAVGDRSRAIQILEIGTGSGCLTIALAKEFPNASLTATDLSKAALEMAQKNINSHDFQERIQLIPADVAPWRVFKAEGRLFDLIVSNPPYIPSDELPELQPEVRDFEPKQALDGGNDGLFIIRQILEEAPDFLKEGSSLLLEVHEGHGPILQKKFASPKGLKLQSVRKDYSQHPRIAIFTKNL